MKHNASLSINQVIIKTILKMETQLLNLLIPDELPTQHELSEANKEKVARSLTLTLQSLDLDSQEQAIVQVNQALTILGTADILPNDFLIKGTKKYRDVLDYDSYFNINHVKSQEPEICLVRSIVVAYRSFLLLSHQSNKFNSENIEIQRQGFRTYCHLLSRVFNLSLIEENDTN